MTLYLFDEADGGAPMPTKTLASTRSTMPVTGWYRVDLNALTVKKANIDSGHLGVESSRDPSYDKAAGQRKHGVAFGRVIKA